MHFFSSWNALIRLPSVTTVGKPSLERGAKPETETNLRQRRDSLVQLRFANCLFTRMTSSFTSSSSQAVQVLGFKLAMAAG
jgi:hypothetical protein